MVTSGSHSASRAGAGVGYLQSASHVSTNDGLDVTSVCVTNTFADPVGAGSKLVIGHGGES